MGLLLSFRGEQEVSPKEGDVYSLEELQDYVGGIIELVWLKDGRLMVVDEEGALKENYFNDKASRLAGCLIFGNALVINKDEIE